MEHEGSSVYACISDFIAPKEAKKEDFVGLFAVTAGIGAADLCAKFEAAMDDYNSMLVKAVADRLAEAYAEYMHLIVRKDLWGYAPEESLNAADLHRIRYDGIRPAPGYPSQPDHTEKELMWRLLKAEEVGIHLSDSLSMIPAASVSGLYFAHPKSHYFAVGKVQKDQVSWGGARMSRNNMLNYPCLPGRGLRRSQERQHGRGREELGIHSRLRARVLKRTFWALLPAVF